MPLEDQGGPTGGPLRGERTGVDERLLLGFRFACRPDCGLCCYASPAVAPEERGALLQLKPPPLLDAAEAPFATIRQRGDGGACGLLRGARCRGHSVRPFPCRIFPVHAYLGERIQLSLVLSCPGLELDAWLRDPGSRAPPEGLESERRAVADDLASPRSQGTIARARRDRADLLERARRRTGFSPLEDLRRRFLERPPLPGSRAAEPDGPAESDGLDGLPLYFDERRGVVALASVPGGTELLALRESGGVADRLGTYPDPTEVPPLEGAGRDSLARYLRYVVERDAVLDALLLEWVAHRPPLSLEEFLAEEVRHVGTLVLRRATVRARADGEPGGPLGAREVARGIRATDAEVLDRIVPGRLL